MFLWGGKVKSVVLYFVDGRCRKSSFSKKILNCENFNEKVDLRQCHDVRIEWRLEMGHKKKEEPQKDSSFLFSSE